MMSGYGVGGESAGSKQRMQSVASGVERSNKRMKLTRSAMASGAALAAYAQCWAA